MSSIAAGHVALSTLELVAGVARPQVPESAIPILVLLASGAVGMSIKNMFDSILSDDEEGDDGGDDLGGGGGGGGLMAEEGGGDDFGDEGGLGLDDDGDIGGFDDGGDDEFGEMGGGGAAAGASSTRNWSRKTTAVATSTVTWAA